MNQTGIRRGSKVLSALRNRASRRLRQLTLAGVARAPQTRGEILRRYGTPTLHELSRSCESFHLDPRDLMLSIPGLEHVPPEIMREADEVIASTAARVSSIDTQYPDFFVAETGMLTLLYVLTRVLRPETVLETGVADGLSTEVLLRALETNQVGELHSIDIRDNVGALVTSRARWHLHVLREGSVSDFASCVDSLGSIDLFFHDANHSYPAQLNEYTTVWDRLRPGAVLASDDVDASYAFMQFVRGLDARSHLLLDRRKVGGIVLKPRKEP